MAKKLVLAGAVAAFLAAANVAYAPNNINSSRPVTYEVENRGLVRIVLPEEIRRKIGKEDEELNLAIKRIELSGRDEIYRYVLDAYSDINVPKYITRKFVRTQIWAESRDYRKAIGKDGERGLMQIMPETWKRIEPKLDFKENAFNPRINIRAGVKHLIDVDRELQRRNSKWGELSDEEKMKLVAAAYNCGVGGLAKAHYNIDKTPEKTKRYIKDIERWMSEKYAKY
jgi:hypothetical protein